MYFLLVGLAAAAVATAESSSTLIPSGISSGCSTFLDQLDSDSTLSSCVQPLINATASFSPNSGSNLTTDDINYTLASICKTSSGCSDSTIRTWLGSFYSACQEELTSSDSYNSKVRELYDILYVVNPLKGAVCAIDSANQAYCVNEIIASEKANGTSSTSVLPSASASASSSGGVSNNTFASFATSSTWSPVSFAAENLYITVTSATAHLTKRMLNYLSPRDVQAQSYATIITPNATTYRTTNLPFLFLQPTMSSGALCTPCTREVLVAYIKWETQQPYALGLSQSPILGGQSALWSAINSTCGSAYVNAITSEVGSYSTTSSTSTGGAMAMVVPSGLALLIAAISGFMAIA